MGDGSGLAEAMLGLDGVRVMNVCEADGEVTIEDTTGPRGWCERWGCRAVTGSDVGRRTRSGVLRPANEVADLEASVAVAVP